MRLFGLPEEVDEQDVGQKISDEFFLSPMHAFKSSSAPDPAADPFFSPSYSSPLVSQSDFAETDLSASPAALFLSAFSPTVAPASLPDAEGEVVAGYVLGPVIGHGGFAIVRSAASPQGGTVAVKIVRRADLDKQANPERARAALDHEAAVWASLSHEHILPLFTSSHTPYADFFVTLYCPAGSLYDILKRDGRPALPQDEAGRMFRQVVKGLRYMHEVAEVVHRDLKLENVLVDEMGMCRIGDFGMAKRIGESDGDDEDRPTPRVGRAQTVRQKRPANRQALHNGLTPHMSLLRHHSGPRHRNSSPLPGAAEASQTQVYAAGSLPYAAPELLTSSSSRHALTAQDMWALGVMLYVLLTGRLPFADSFEPRLQMKILAGNFDMPEGIGRGAERVLLGCLESSVENRWTIEMVDEVAWGIGWGDAGDEAPCPTDALPPVRSSRSHSRASVPEHAVVDDNEPNSPSSDRPTPSRSRSGRSRSRASVAFHPYQHDQHFPSHVLDPSVSGMHSAILRSVSTSSSSSNCFSPVSPPQSAVPSHSSERGRSRGFTARTLLSPSRSRSPPKTPITPVDVATALAARGRKPSRAATSASPLEPRRLQHLPENVVVEDDWLASPMGDERRMTRSASRDMLARAHADLARAESVPPHSLCSMPWSVQSFPGAGTGTATPGSMRAQAARSRSVGFDLVDRAASRRMGRPCGEN
ncbi:hypothetical protein PHLGIDRAFT_499534 [Phlebiopsis gigantea 11061_1 CR5-6]|uniref:Protein kinase domain-containing protein n=1 Tax=Phlebiopsis gigantea (strain 11061_1 CR5-6) TaxID=745531 RepID=A0A0C3S4I1_PHLG1|nr:hypothetical protein PHLGIDRAFT_499534 [Phlebiopsis gigantea 11061_1 CR5-6]